MKQIFNLRSVLLITLLFFFVVVNSQNKILIKASDPNIQYSGRIDYTNLDNVVFSYSGVTIKAKFQGTSIDAVLTDFASDGAMHTNYFNVIIDSKEPFSFSINSPQTIYPLATGLTDGSHTITLFKRTDCNVGSVEFNGFRLDEGKTLLPVDPLPSRKIEFIGSSITCGFGIEASYTQAQLATITGFNSVNENNYKAYGAITSRNLNAQYSCVAYAGRGLCINSTGTTTGTIPQIYDYVIPDEAAIKWNHNLYIPDVIVINLGTNDFSAEGAGYTTIDSAMFVNSYINFITKLRGYYPNAKIICAVGVMMNDNWPSGKNHWTRIQNYVNSVKTYKNQNGDNNVYYLKLDTQNPPYGEDWHPTAETQNIMATKITNYIKSITGWNCNTIPTLGKDISTCDNSFPIILNSHITTDANITCKWYKNNIIIPTETGSMYQIISSKDAAGTYKIERDSAGCITSDEIIVSNSMPKPNLGKDKTLCSPTFAILDAGISGRGISYIWEKDNSVLMNSTTQKITTTTPGTFIVHVSSSTCNTMSDTIVIGSKLLKVSLDTICSAGSLTLNVSGGTGIYEWYNTANGETPLYEGAAYTTLVGSNTTYYVKDAGGVPYSVGKKVQDKSELWALSMADYQVIDKQDKIIVQKACILSKLSVYPATNGIDVTIRIMKGTTVIASKTQKGLNTGKQTIQLDFMLEPGSYTLSAIGTTGSLMYQSDSGSFPYSIPKVFTLTNSESWSKTRYGFFYDLVVFVGNTCDHTPVPVVIDSTYKNCKKAGIKSNVTNTQNKNVNQSNTPEMYYIKLNKIEDQKAVLHLMNSQGRIVIEKEVKIIKSIIQLDVSTLPKGVYSYIIKAGTETRTGSVVL